MLKPGNAPRTPSEGERAALAELAVVLEGEAAVLDGEGIQWHVYEIGKRHQFANLRAWFSCLYQVLLGQDEGPRFGHFAAIYGPGRTAMLIRDALARESMPSPAPSP